MPPDAPPKRHRAAESARIQHVQSRSIHPVRPEQTAQRSCRNPFGSIQQKDRSAPALAHGAQCIRGTDVA